MKEGIALKTLADNLQDLHPANLAAGASLLREWALAEFHDGEEPPGGKGHPLLHHRCDEFAISQSWADHLLFDSSGAG